jgi:hypothetical protein
MKSVRLIGGEIYFNSEAGSDDFSCSQYERKCLFHVLNTRIFTLPSSRLDAQEFHRNLKPNWSANVPQLIQHSF